MTYKFEITFGLTTEKITVGSDYGLEWAETRAIAAFLYRHQEWEAQLNCPAGTFTTRAEVAKKLGLVIKCETDVLRNGNDN